MDWLYVLPDAGKRTTPDMTAAFTRTIHDCESAARKKHYRGYKKRAFIVLGRPERSVLTYQIYMNAR